LESKQKYDDSKKKKDHSAHDHKRNKHKEDKKDHITDPKPSTSKSIEQLRAERLRREKEERAKTEKLLAKARGETVPEEKRTEVVTDERERRYNSQFNPDFVRKPKKKHQYY